MKLYHGTSEALIQHILSMGIKPRGDRDSNWECESHPEAVYLTTAYGLFYSSPKAEDEDVDRAIIEVNFQELDRTRLAPDEDFLAQQYKAEYPIAGKSLVEYTEEFRPFAYSEYRNLWGASIELLGTCAYYGIVDPSAISRIAIIPKDHDILLASDPTITVQNYKFMGAYYRNLTKYIFGDDDFEYDPIGQFKLENLPSHRKIEVLDLG